MLTSDMQFLLIKGFMNHWVPSIQKHHRISVGHLRAEAKILVMTQVELITRSINLQKIFRKDRPHYNKLAMPVYCAALCNQAQPPYFQSGYPTFAPPTFHSFVECSILTLTRYLNQLKYIFYRVQKSRDKMSSPYHCR